MTILSNKVQLALDITGKLNPYGWLNAFVNEDRVLLIDNPNMYMRCGYTYYSQFLFDDLEMPQGSAWVYRQDFYNPGKLPKFYKDKPHITAKDFGVIDLKGCVDFDSYLSRLKRTNRNKVKRLEIYKTTIIPYGAKFLSLIAKAKKQLEAKYKNLDEDDIVSDFDNLKSHLSFIETKYELEDSLKPYLIEMSIGNKVVGYAISYNLHSERGMVCVNSTDMLKSEGYNVKQATASCINWAISKSQYDYMDISNALGMDNGSMYYKHQFYTSIGGERDTVELYFDSQETLDEYLKVNWKAYGVPFESAVVTELAPLSFLGVNFKQVVSKPSYDIHTIKLTDLTGGNIVELVNYIRSLADPDAPELDNRIVPLMMNPSSVMDLLTTKTGHLLSMTISYPVAIHEKSYVDQFVSRDIFEGAWYLDEMYTPITERKKGYARLLLSYTLKDKANISLTVAENNPAILLYKDLGFKMLDRVPNYYPNLLTTDPYALTGLTLYRHVNS